MQRLPRSLESDPQLQTFLARHTSPLQPESSLSVPTIALHKDLQEALAFARRCGRVRGGLESIEIQMQKEAAGLAKVAAKGTPNQPSGASRILFVSNDGSPRFYRSTQSLVAKHSPRLYLIKLDLSSEQMGKQFFGPEAKVKAMLVSEKDFVIKCFQALQEKV